MDMYLYNIAMNEHSILQQITFFMFQYLIILLIYIIYISSFCWKVDVQLPNRMEVLNRHSLSQISYYPSFANPSPVMGKRSS